jgi:hypothetical protein
MTHQFFHRLSAVAYQPDLVQRSAAMDEYYSKLAGALRERLALIADHHLRDQNPVLHLEKLKDASTRIDQLKADLPMDADPMLVHYIQRMSLSKALEFIEHAYLQ